MAAGQYPAEAIVTAIELSEEQVRAYLKENADFLQRNPDLLDHLHISHASGSTVSLVEKQVSVLRERNSDIRHRLNALTTNARDNDRLFEQSRRLVLALLDAGSIEALYRAFINTMKENFEVEHASMILFGEPDADSDCRIETAESAKIEIGALIRSHQPVCGVLRKEELAYLFPDAGEIGSAALMPLVGAEEMGLVAVGSSDANYYGSGTGTLFLSHVAEVLVRVLPRLR